MYNLVISLLGGLFKILDGKISMLKLQNKFFIVVIGIVVYFTKLIIKSIYIGYLPPSYVWTWIADIEANYQRIAFFMVAILDFLVVAAPICLLFGVATGRAFREKPLGTALLIGFVYIATEWIHFYFLFKIIPPFMGTLYIVQDILIILLFIFAVLFGSKWKNRLTN